MPGTMRYPDSGGLSAEGRARREIVRLQAAQLFAQDASPVQVAHRLRVSTKSAYQWRRRWRAGGQAALASAGPGGCRRRLTGTQLARLRAALEQGPAAWGWTEDQRWTLPRVTTLIGRMCHVRYTLCVPRIPSTALTRRVGLPSRLTVTITGHVPAVRVPSHRAGGHVAAAVPA